MKKFIIDSNVLDLLTDLQIGILVLELPEKEKEFTKEELMEIEKILKDANREAKKYLTYEVISENEVVKVWRNAYAKFPTKKGARCSIENLLKRVLHDNSVGTILPSVDITNAISLKYALPIGVEDLDKIVGNMHLGVMKGDESFKLISESEEETPLKGEVAYKDDIGVVCRCLNWRDGERTKVDENTRREFIAMECVDSKRVNKLEEALDELCELMTKYLNVTIINKEILNKDNIETSIE